RNRLVFDELGTTVGLEQPVLAPTDDGQREDNEEVEAQEMPRHTSPRVWDKQISLAPDSLDPLGGLGLIAELAAQSRDTDVQHPVRAVIFALEEILEEGFA